MPFIPPAVSSWLARWIKERSGEAGRQGARGLAESGYATALGATRLAEQAAPIFQHLPGSGMALAGKAMEQAGRMSQPIERSRDEMREYYGDPESLTGTIAQGAGNMVGSAAQFMVPGAGAMRGGFLPASAPMIRRVATELALGMPIDALMGAGVEPEESLTGLAGKLTGSEMLQGMAQTPLGRAAGDVGAGLGLGMLADSRQLMHGIKNARQAKWVEVGAEDFNRALQEFAKAKPEQAGFITWRTPEQMREEGMRMFVTPRGDAGFAIHPESGDIRNLFTAGAPPGTGAYGLAHAMNKGGGILDAFDTNLTQIYRDMGFNETARMPWDDAYRPGAWDEARYGKPDVVNMEYRGERGTPDELFDLYQERRSLRTGKPRPPAPEPTMVERLMSGLRRFATEEHGIAGDVQGIRDLTELKRYLRPDEKRIVEHGAAEPVLATFRRLPSVEELTAGALAGKAKRGWYRNSSRAIVDSYGKDAPRFAALLAAMSPQTSVENNLQNAMSVWNAWVKAGAPTDRAAITRIMGEAVQRADLEKMPMDRLMKMAERAQEEFGVVFPRATKGMKPAELRAALSQLPEEQLKQLSVLPGWVPNSVTALSHAEPTKAMLSGPKVDSFWRNLMDDVDAVTLDTHMAKLAAMDQSLLGGSRTQLHPGKTPSYVAYTARVRQVADRLRRLTGQSWTPAEVQETAWSWAYALGEDVGGGAKTFGKKGPGALSSRVGEVTDEMVRSTPSFDELFSSPQYAGLLEQGGLPLPARAAPADAGLDVAGQLQPRVTDLETLAGNMERHAAGDFAIAKPKGGGPRKTAAHTMRAGIEGPGGEAFTAPTHYGAVVEAQGRLGRDPMQESGWRSGFFSDLLGFLNRRQAYDLLTPAQRRVADKVMAEQGWPAEQLTSEALGEIRARAGRSKSSRPRSKRSRS